MNDIEIWKLIGIGEYAISNLGNVKSKNGTRQLKPSLNKQGYLTVCITDNGIKKTTKIHKLVMTTFLGDRPNGCDIDHIDRCRTNNKLTNLRYCTRQQNCMNTCRTRRDILETDPKKRKRIIMTEWFNKNQDYVKQYKLTNKEKISEKMKQYRLANIEKLKEYKKEYYLKHKQQATPCDA
jgi:hypothetical protein